MSKDHTLPCSAIVIKKYEAVYPEPVVIKKGEQVQELPAPEEWAGWVWCEITHGVLRWVPVEYLSKHGSKIILNRDYDSTELTVALGEQLTIHNITAGWAWCQKTDGNHGWVPTENFEMC